MEIIRNITLTNKFGLHARPATKLVGKASQFRSDIYISKDGVEVNGKSIIEILTLAAEHGSSIIIKAVGEDAEMAVDSLISLLSGLDDEDQGREK